MSGPARVLSGAGTGKTLVAWHRARWFGRKVFKGENDRVLFTTLAENLAADIRKGRYGTFKKLAMPPDIWTPLEPYVCWWFIERVLCYLEVLDP